MEISEKLQGILATLPAKPGVYMMKNAEGKNIYVGKAISLSGRDDGHVHVHSRGRGRRRSVSRSRGVAPGVVDPG